MSPRDEFIKKLRKLVRQIDIIDSNTIASTQNEPKWWVDMMELRRRASKIITKHEYGNANEKNA